MRAVFGVFLGIVFTQTPAALGPPIAGWPAVERVFHQQVQSAGIVGSSLLVVRDGRLAASAVDGYQDLDAKRPVDVDTIYHWASITKTFTGIAIMQLRDRGQLALDDPIVKYVPEFRQVHNPYGDPAQVTIRHMMTHSSGLRAPTWPWGGDEPWHPFEPTRWEQLVAMLPYTVARASKNTVTGHDARLEAGQPRRRHPRSSPSAVRCSRIGPRCVTLFRSSQFFS